MRNSDSDNLQEVNCPRCGYDQRGLVHSWRDVCPLEATCAECGLVYPCAATLLPEKFEPPWCVEYCPAPPLAMVKACAATFMRSLLPWRFWSRLRMSDRIRWNRIVLYLIALFMCVLFVRAVVSPMVEQWEAALRTWQGIHMERAEAVAVRQRQIARLRNRPAVHDYQLRGLSEEQRDRYIVWAEQAVQHQIATLQSEIDNMPVVDHSLPLAILEAVLLPLAESSFGSIVHADGTIDPYPAPIELWQESRDTVSLQVYSPQVIRFGPTTYEALLICVLMYLAFPLTFIMVPMTRRSAKVRWAHIWRVAAYGVIIPLLAVFLATLLLLTARSGIGGAGLMALHIFAAAWFTPMAMVLWWTFAIARYLKMPHAFWIALLHSYVVLLFILAIAWLLWPALLFPVD